MKRNIGKIAVCAVTLFAVQYVFGAPPPHRHKDDGRGVRLATDIVNLVKAVVLPPPAPVVVAPAPAVVAPAPAVVAPAPAVVAPVEVVPAAVTVPATITYGYYNNVYVPCWNGWYFYNNVWCWGGHGRRPPHPPAWRPPYRHHRVAPPPARPAYRPVYGRPVYGRPAPGRHQGHRGGRR